MPKFIAGSLNARETSLVLFRHGAVERRQRGPERGYTKYTSYLPFVNTPAEVLGARRRGMRDPVFEFSNPKGEHHETCRPRPELMRLVLMANGFDYMVLTLPKPIRLETGDVIGLTVAQGTCAVLAHFGVEQLN